MELFREAGVAGWAILCCAMVGNPVALIALFGAFLTKKRSARLGLGGAALALGLLTVVAGVGGYLWGMHRAQQAVAFASPDMRQQLLAAARAEALSAVWLALVGCVLPILLGAVALVRGLTTPAEPPEGG
ncbi:MAG TPA: hypothetical protein RMH99_08965 [Sandaracinaceae bacterium LLY-WYZ-13_1]|nr:hypothetical protein [Sandaracinaceae bacterium LLY-WYZ-13_1]